MHGIQAILSLFGLFFAFAIIALYSYNSPIHYYYGFVLVFLLVIISIVAYIFVAGYLMRRRTLGKNKVTDSNNGLIWMFLRNKGIASFEYKNPQLVDRKEIYYATDVPHLVNGNAKINHGYSDWRLPTREELGALLGTEYAPKSGEFWTADTRSLERVWVVNFERRRIYSVWEEYSECSVVLVRGKLNPPSSNT